MSKLTLWGHPRSINVQKPLWTLEELGLPYERIDIGGSFGKNKEPEYLALNPNGLIPTLVDDGQPLWESNAIVRYLASRYSKAPFWPEDPIVRARSDAWTEWYNGTLWANVRPLLVQLVRTPEDKRDLALIESTKQQSLAAVTLLDRELQGRAYVAGNDFTFGDIPIGSALQRWYNLPIKRPEHKALDAYYARLKERPGFKRWIDLPLA